MYFAWLFKLENQRGLGSRQVLASAVARCVHDKQCLSWTHCPNNVYHRLRHIQLLQTGIFRLNAN